MAHLLSLHHFISAIYIYIYIYISAIGRASQPSQKEDQRRKRRGKVPLEMTHTTNNYLSYPKINHSKWLKINFCIPSTLIPLLPSSNYSYRIIKISFSKKEGIKKKNFLGAPRLWVGRRWEPILGYISKFDGIKVSGINGLNCLGFRYCLVYFLSYGSH